MRSLVRRPTMVVLVLALVVGLGVIAVVVRDDPRPVAIVGVEELDADNLVTVILERCGDEPHLALADPEDERIVVEVVARSGSGDDCSDTIDVAIVPERILELEDTTSGQVFALVRASSAD